MNGDADRDGELSPRGEPDNWSEGDVDVAFAAIVARYSRTGPAIGPWPVVEELDTTAPADGRPGPATDTAGSAPAPATGPGRMTSGAGAGAPESRVPGPGAAGPGSPAGPVASAGSDASAGSADSGPPESSGRPESSGHPEEQRTAETRGAIGPDPAGDHERPPHERPPHETRAEESSPAYGTRDLHEAGPGETSRRDRRPDAGDDPAGRSGGRHAFDPAQDGEDLDDERFVPPEPPPLHRGDFFTTFAWVCVLGGPLLLLFAALAWRDIPGELILAAVVAFIGGFVTLVARMPGDVTDDPDDGAVV